MFVVGKPRPPSSKNVYMRFKLYVPVLFAIAATLTACDRNSDHTSTSGTNSAAADGPGSSTSATSTSAGAGGSARGPGTATPTGGTGGDSTVPPR
jgi:hypothetical protein